VGKDLLLILAVKEPRGYVTEKKREPVTGLEDKVDKRALSSNCYNDLQNFVKEAEQKKQQRRVRADTTLVRDEEEQEWSPDHPLRGSHNKEDQFEPGTTEKKTAGPTSRSKQGQVARRLTEEIIHSKTRPGKERRREYQQYYISKGPSGRLQLQVIKKL
ncbi:hypothetical protein TNIN_330341, partial [Trichonephila inaurata madagascariensis]